MTRSGTTASSAEKRVYLFGGGKAEGNAELKDLLGGKGANLAEMASLSLPVPPGFTITTEVCTAYYAGDRKLPDGLAGDVEAALAHVWARRSAGHSAILARRCSYPCAPARAPQCRG